MIKPLLMLDVLPLRNKTRDYVLACLLITSKIVKVWFLNFHILDKIFCILFFHRFGHVELRFYLWLHDGSDLFFWRFHNSTLSISFCRLSSSCALFYLFSSLLVIHVLINSILMCFYFFLCGNADEPLSCELVLNSQSDCMMVQIFSFHLCFPNSIL